MLPSCRKQQIFTFFFVYCESLIKITRIGIAKQKRLHAPPGHVVALVAKEGVSLPQVPKLNNGGKPNQPIYYSLGCAFANQLSAGSGYIVCNANNEGYPQTSLFIAEVFIYSKRCNPAMPPEYKIVLTLHSTYFFSPNDGSERGEEPSYYADN